MTHAGSHLDGKIGTAEPSMFQSVSVKLRISLSCLRFLFLTREKSRRIVFLCVRRRQGVGAGLFFAVFALRRGLLRR